MCAIQVHAQLTGVTQVSRNGHSCAVTAAGGLKCWGNNNYGQLGDGTTVLSPNPVDVQGLSNGVIQVAAGNGHTCALTSVGGVKCWGYNYYGQVGDNSTTDRSTPTDVVGLTSGVRAVFAGVRMSCAITTGNVAKCWGMNDWGELGDGTVTRRRVPIDVVGLGANVETMAVGYRHACAVLFSGALKCWGNNDYGQVGDGTLTQRLSPVAVVGYDSGVLGVAVGLVYSCAVSTLGAVKCWGDNTEGQLGNGTTVGSNTPIDVTGLGSEVVQLAIQTGSSTSCALLADGSAKCWGDNGRGQVGDGTKITRSIPTGVQGLSQRITSFSNGCVVLEDSTAYCWGENGTGARGNGATLDRYSAEEINGFVGDATLIGAGQYSTCATDEAGTLRCWGNNGNGQLGDGSLTARYLPVVTTGVSNVISVSSGQAQTCSVLQSGAVKCWGYGGSCVLGNGSSSDFSTPQTVSGFASGGQMVATGWLHSCAVNALGGVLCWGSNGSGRLGDGTTTGRCTPVSVVGLSSGIAEVGVGVAHSCARSLSGEVWCWGDNGDGQVGDGTNATRLSPVQVTGFSSPVVSVSLGYYHTCALSDDGQVRCWGSNGYGRLGDGSNTSSNRPVLVQGLSGGAVAIAAGGYHTCAALATGGIKCWGLNSYGQLGDLTTVNSFTPVAVEGANGVFSSLSLGRYHSCSISAEHKAFCWGYNSRGQITDLSSSDILLSPVLRLFNVTGHVTLGGVALSGVTLSATNFGPQYPNQHAASDASGYYQFSVTESLSYRITPSLNAYHFTPVEVSGVISSDTVHDFVAELNHYTISGVVQAGGMVLSGALVDGGALGTQVTDDNGYYIFSNIPHGTVFSLTASHEGAVIDSSGASGTLVSYLTINLSGNLKTYSIYGTATLEGSSSYAGVVLQGGQLGSQTTTMDGRYAFRNIEFRNHYQIQPVMFGYKFLPTRSTGVIESDLEINYLGKLADSDNDGLKDLDEIRLGTKYNLSDTDSDGIDDGAEVAGGSNPLDRGSHIRVADTDPCVEWNGYLGMFNVMEHYNSGDRKLTIENKLHDIFGRVRGKVAFGLRPGYQFDVLVHDLPGFEADIYGLICSTPTNEEFGELDGNMVFYKPNLASSGWDFAFALPFGSGLAGTQFLPYNTYQPSLNPNDISNLVANWIQVTNLSRRTESGQLILYDREGKEIVSQSVALRSGARFDYSGHDLVGRAQVGLVKWAPKDEAARFQLRNVRYYYHADGEIIPLGDNFDSAFQLEGIVGSGQLLSVPLDTLNSIAVLEIANTLSEDVKVEVEIYPESGINESTNMPLHHKVYKLQPHATVHFIANSVLGGGKGIATIKGNKASSVFATAMHYGLDERLGIQTVYGIQAQEALGDVMRGSYNTFLKQSCRLLLVNPLNAESTVVLSMKRYDGTDVDAGRTIAVPAKGLSNYNLCDREIKDVYGVVTVRPKVPNSIFATVLRIGNNEDYRFPTPVRQ